MINAEKYKTFPEQEKYFVQYCKSQKRCPKCRLFKDGFKVGCKEIWLNLDIQEEIEKEEAT